MVLGHIIGVVLGGLVTFLIMKGTLEKKDLLIQRLNSEVDSKIVEILVANQASEIYMQSYDLLYYGVYYNPETDKIITLDKLERIGDL
jgi:hypothetical protein